MNVDVLAKSMASVSLQGDLTSQVTRQARVRHNVAEDTEVVQRPYSRHEEEYHRQCRKNLNQVAQALHQGTTPSPLELARLNLLLGFKGESKAAEETFAEDALTTLVQRRFNVHSDLTQVTAERHVRLCYRAARKLRGQAVHRLSEHYQRLLIEQLLALSSFAQEQNNPNALFVLSCLRNCIVEVPSDRSLLRLALRYGIAGAQIAGGALMQQPGAAVGGAREIASLAQMAFLRPNGWWSAVKEVESISHAIEWAACRDQHDKVAENCHQLLARTGAILKDEVPRLQRFDVGIKNSLKQAFNSLGVRQVDHEWDLAFACLDALQRNVWAYDREEQLQQLLHQVTAVLRLPNAPELRFKCIELLRELQQLPSLRPPCQVLLHLAGLGAAEQVRAVASKRRVERSLGMDIMLEVRSELAHAADATLSFAAPLQLNRSGTLRLQAPRLGAAVPAHEVSPPTPGAPPPSGGAFSRPAPGRGAVHPAPRPAPGEWVSAREVPAWEAWAGHAAQGTASSAFLQPRVDPLDVFLAQAPLGNNAMGSAIPPEYVTALSTPPPAYETFSFSGSASLEASRSRGQGGVPLTRELWVQRAGTPADRGSTRGAAPAWAPPPPPRLAPADVADRLRLRLAPGEATVLLCDALRRRDAAQLFALLRAGIHDVPDAELPPQQVREALEGRRVQGPLPKRLLGLAVVLQDVACMRAIASRTGERRGFVGAAAVREAQALAQGAGLMPAADGLRRALRELAQQPAPAGGVGTPSSVDGTRRAPRQLQAGAPAARGV